MGAPEEEKFYKKAIFKRYLFSGINGFRKQIKIVRKIFQPEFSLLKEIKILYMKSYRKRDSL